MGLRDILKTASTVLQGLSETAIITNWLQLADRDAFDAIVAQVKSCPTDVLDRLDGALLSAASAHYDASVRLRLTKFYAMFKIAETLRFDMFRGFPE
jgi:hypothetical protein